MVRNDIVSYLEMCGREGLSLQRGMNYNLPPKHCIFLSSYRPGAPYEDRLDETGKVLIYEGHDEPRSSRTPRPKLVDQPLETPSGRPTQNGLFLEAAQAHMRGDTPALEVRVYEKTKDGIWSYNGRFELKEGWIETTRGRRICKFQLHQLADTQEELTTSREVSLVEQSRLIPASVKLAVWKRDKGACTVCGATSNLHFDHILAYSKGGTSFSEKNIQLLCMKHNLAKGARI